MRRLDCLVCELCGSIGKIRGVMRIFSRSVLVSQPNSAAMDNTAATSYLITCAFCLIDVRPFESLRSYLLTCMVGVLHMLNITDRRARSRKEVK